ncbi:MAG: RNA-binding S4 domain-containing protein [Candidatus Caldatribacteriota bacterium]|nr:RNA-binding S4 domain-containing protein [Candidatus Caldatribacteriota bacterium]
MRLDKYLKISRIIKRRTEAKKACLAKCVKVNQRIAKAGDEIKMNDEIEIRFSSKIIRVKVLEAPLKNIPAKHASSLYKILEEIIKKED